MQFLLISPPDQLQRLLKRHTHSSSVTLTQLFAPALDSSSPSSSSRRQAFCTVFGLSPSIAESTLREGSSSPSAISPETMPCFTNRIICK